MQRIQRRPADPMKLIRDGWSVQQDTPPNRRALWEEKADAGQPLVTPRPYAVNSFPSEVVMVDTKGTGMVDSLVIDQVGDGDLTDVINLSPMWTLNAMSVVARAAGKIKKKSPTCVKLTAAHNMAQQALKSGDVVVHIPRGTKLAPVSKQDQACESLNTLDAFRNRHLLRDDPGIHQVISDWWTEDLKLPIGSGGMTKTQYTDSGIKIMRSICPGESFADVKAAVEEDWLADSAGAGTMTFQAFFDCMFELADMWVNSVNGHDYADFLRGIRKATSSGRGLQRVGAAGMWRVARDMLAVPRTLYQAGGYDINNFEERIRVAKHAVKEIVKLVDQFSQNGKITITEMQAMLEQTSFEGFSDWMTKYNRRNWARYDHDKDGRIDEDELYHAVMGFLVSDGYGRAYAKVDELGHDVHDKKTRQVKPENPYLAKKESQKRDEAACIRGEVLVSGPANVTADLKARRSWDEISSGGDGGAEVDKTWWVHMKTLAKAIEAIDGFQQAKKQPHYMRSSLVLTNTQRENAMKAFKRVDISGDGEVQQQELFVAMGLLDLKLKPDELKKRVFDAFKDADRDESGGLTFEEFVLLYNRVYMSSIDYGDFLG